MSAKPKVTELVPANDAVPLVPSAPASEAALVLQMAERLALNPNCDMAKLQQMLDVFRQIKADNAKQAFSIAMSKAQAEMEPIRADSNNPQTKSKYASLSALDRAIRPIYTRHGFAPSFDTAESAHPDTIIVICDLLHTEGHTKRYQIPIPADGKGAKGGDVMTKTHATIAATSYGQRALLKLAFNLSVDRDDDGNRASAPVSGPISQAQLDTLITFADRIGLDKARICKAEKIGGLALLPASRFDAVMRKLQLTERQKAQ